MPDGNAERVRADVAVVGAGPAGIAAAVAAAGAGRRVALLDACPNPGGQVWRHRHRSALPGVARHWLERLDRSGATLLLGASVVDVQPGFRIGAERGARPLVVEAETVVLATGAQELFLPFPGWTLPGVVGVGGAQALVKGGMDVRGKRVAVAGTGPLLLPVAAALARAGADLRMVAEQAPAESVKRFARSLWRTPRRLVQAAAYRAAFPHVRYRWGTWVKRVDEVEGALEVIYTTGRSTWAEPIDLLCTASGLVPSTELARLLGCRLRDGTVEVNEWQETSLAGIYAAGEPTGNTGMDAALVEGSIAGLATAGQRDAARHRLPVRDAHRHFAEQVARSFRLRDELRERVRFDTIVCRCEDVPCSAVRSDWTAREAKIAARVGMGPCQGRMCGPAMQFLFGASGGRVQVPVTPIPVDVLAELASPSDEPQGVR